MREFSKIKTAKQLLFAEKRLFGSLTFLEREFYLEKFVMAKAEQTKSKKPLDEFKALVGDSWLPEIYEKKVRPLRTRAFSLGVAQRENETEILYTLLGVELKIGRQRITCPDLAAARFLQVFARIGVSEVAIPYDITKISVLADELESAWQRLLLLLEQATENAVAQTTRARLRSQLVKELRREITEIGAGSLMPQFNQNTKQRKS